MAKDATDTPRGTDYTTENCPTNSTEPTAKTPKMEPSGVAASATGSDTRARSSVLSADEAQKLARIRKDRANRFMVSVVDVDFLLEILERLSR